MADTPPAIGHDASQGNQCLPCVEGVHCHWRNYCGCTVCMPFASEHEIGSGGWLRERFPEKDWHQHPRMDGRTDWCDGTPSDCITKERIAIDEGGVCGRCGKDPAAGYAVIGTVRYCHDDEDYPTCYMRTLWERNPAGDTTT